MAHDRSMPCEWAGLPFERFMQIDEFLKKSRGTASQYFHKGIKLDGHYVICENHPKHKQRTDQDLIDFYSFVNARRDQLPKLKLEGMIKLFDKSKL